MVLVVSRGLILPVKIMENYNETALYLLKQDQRLFDLLRANFVSLLGGTFEKTYERAMAKFGVSYVGELFPTAEIQDPKIFPSLDPLEKPLSTLKLLDIDLFLELTSHYEGVCIFQAKGILASSSPKAFSLFFCEAEFFKMDIEEQIFVLVHEFGHQEFFLLNSIDNLITMRGNKRLEYSELPNKNRPGIARFHALFVLYRMHQFSIKNAFLKRQIDIKNKIDNYLKTFNEGDFTDFGYKIFNIIKEQK